MRYVSGEINYDALKYNERITNYYKRKIGSFDDYIEKLERFASVMFSYTFLLFFAMISIVLFMFPAYVLAFLSMELTDSITQDWDKIFTLIKGNGNQKLIAIFGILANLHIALGMVVAFDFITLGLLKKIKQKHFSWLYFWIYRYMSTVTLSFLWHPMLLNFLDAKFTKSLFFLIVPYIIALLMLPNYKYIYSSYYPALNLYEEMHLEQSKYAYNPIFYDDEIAKRKDKALFVRLYSIPSKRVHGRVFELFMRNRDTDDDFIQLQDSTLKPLRNKGFKRHRYQIQNKEGLNNFLAVKQLTESSFWFDIDERPVPPESVDCDYYLHPDNQQEGMLCFFPLDSLEIGRHYLTIHKVRVLNQRYLDTIEVTIPFVYEGE